MNKEKMKTWAIGIVCLVAIVALAEFIKIGMSVFVQ